LRSSVETSFAINQTNPGPIFKKPAFQRLSGSFGFSDIAMSTAIGGAGMAKDRTGDATAK
jgi:hypothetical protein